MIMYAFCKDGTLVAMGLRDAAWSGWSGAGSWSNSSQKWCCLNQSGESDGFRDTELKGNREFDDWRASQCG